MRRVLLLWPFALGGCSNPLEDWCNHESSAREECPTPELSFNSGAPDAAKCGSFVVTTTVGYALEKMYFQLSDGEFVAVGYTSDVNFEETWYGKSIRCELECVYNDQSTLAELGVPICDETPDW